MRQLAELPCSTPAEVKSWYAEAGVFEAYVQTSDVELPHFVWHYLSDADIRARDSEYRASQDREIREIISELEQGRVPEETSTPISPKVVTGLVLVAVTCIIGIARACF